MSSRLRIYGHGEHAMHQCDDCGGLFLATDERVKQGVSLGGLGSFYAAGRPGYYCAHCGAHCGAHQKDSKVGGGA